jgi:nitrogen-specific signal transduction histidine kinase
VAVADRPEDGVASAGARDRAHLTPSAAHEINNPLDALLNLLYLLEAEPLSENGRHYLTVAQEEVRRVALIARETLNEHRVETIADRTDVAGLFASVLDLYKQRFDSSGITVSTRYAPDCTIPIFARQLRQVFSNLTRCRQPRVAERLRPEYPPHMNGQEARGMECWSRWRTTAQECLQNCCMRFSKNPSAPKAMVTVWACRW